MMKKLAKKALAHFDAALAVLVVAVTLVAFGCSAAQVAELKADAAVAASDAHTGLVLLAGAAQAAASNPAALAEAQAIAGAVLKKTSVPPATAAKITGALTTGNAAALQSAALEGASLTASASAASSK